MIRKLFIVFLFSILQMSFVMAQYTARDSALYGIKNSPEDSTKLDYYNQLLAVSYMDDPKGSLAYAQEMIAYSERINYPRGIVDGCGWSGYLIHEIGKVDEALKYYIRAMEIAQKMGWKDDVMGLSNNIGSTYIDIGKTDLGIHYYFISLKMMDELGETKHKPTLMTNIATTYYAQGKIREALEMLYQSMFMAEKQGNLQGLTASMEHIGLIYFEQRAYQEALPYIWKVFQLNLRRGNKEGVAHGLNLIADVCMVNGYSQMGLQYYHQAIEKAKLIDDYNEVGLVLLDIGDFYFNQKNMHKALACYSQGLDYIVNSMDREGTAMATFRMGRYYFYNGDDANAMKFLTESYEIAKELDFPKHIRNAAGLLYQLHAKKGDKTVAFDIYHEYNVMEDSIQNDEARRAIISQKLRFEFERDKMIQEEAEQEMARIKKARIARRNTLQNSVIFIFILIGFGVILSFGFIKVPDRLAQVLIFVSLLFLFEFLLVLTDPYLDNYTKGIPVYKLLVNSILAISIFPIHAFLEKRLKRKIKK